MKVDPPSATIYRLFMALPSSSATDEMGSIPVAPDVVAAIQAKEPARAFLQSARRNLSDDELATPAARRFLIADLERLDQTCADLQSYAEKYHDQRVTIATLTSSEKDSRRHEILSSICLGVGSAGLGAAPSYLALKDGGALGIMILGFSLILIFGGVASRVFK